MGTRDQVIGCVDGSEFAGAVCDCAAWASTRLSAPLTLLHAIEYRHGQAPVDMTGSIGFGSQESLLEALAAHDHHAGKLAMERGRHLLETARERVQAAGAPPPTLRQVHGSLVEQVEDVEAAARLLVIGRRGEGAHAAPHHLGSSLERIIRALHCPILVVPAAFQPPASFMLAFDNSASTRKGVEVLMRGPLFTGMRCHLVTAAEAGSELDLAHQGARRQLQSAGFDVRGGVYQGDAETVLTAYLQDHGIELLVMGAYGHTRIRQLLVGSTTTSMIRGVTTPLLLLR